MHLPKLQALSEGVDYDANGRMTVMIDGSPWTYFKIGAKVNQSPYAGAPAKVVGIEEPKRHSMGHTRYELEVDVSKHPDGYDENGDRVKTKLVWVTDQQLNKDNPV